eukprot:COSAG01_NODE_1437_length_10311_cov_11.678613_4_plen_66_part_00
MVIGGMVKGVILGHPGATHAVEERRLVVGVGRVQLMYFALQNSAVAIDKLNRKTGASLTGASGRF